jgi:hypothetical protein
MHHFQKLKISGCRGGGERVEGFFGNLADVLSRRLVEGRVPPRTTQAIRRSKVKPRIG